MEFTVIELSCIIGFSVGSALTLYVLYIKIEEFL